MKLLLRDVSFSLVLCLLMVGCAQTGPPLPPSLELPKPPSDLHASRKGNLVTLTWTQPAVTTDRLGVRYLGPTRICRALKTQFTACGNPAGTLPAPAIPPNRSRKKPRKPKSSSSSSPAQVTQTYSDALPSVWLQRDSAEDVIYAVEVLNRNGRGAGISNLVRVPAVSTLPAPGDLAATLSGDGVSLTWTSEGETQPAKEDDSSTQSARVQHRYRIYRREEATGNDAVAGEVEVNEAGPAHFTDSGFAWEKTYLYRVTAVSTAKRPEGEVQVEGEDSAAVRVVAHDIFPPAVPAGLQAAYSGEGQKPFIDLIWAPVTTADLAGYNIYRSEGSGGPTTKLNSELVKSPSYRDFTVESGKTYTYTLSSVDVRGNESPKSESANEAVP
jgi:hypothetical protein